MSNINNIYTFFLFIKQNIFFIIIQLINIYNDYYCIIYKKYTKSYNKNRVGGSDLLASFYTTVCTIR